MSIKTQLTGEIPYYLTPGDEFLISFDISTWLGTDEIDTVAYSATDEAGETTTACYDSDKSEKTTNIFKPYIKAGDTNAKKFILECEITTVSTYVKTFYIIFKVNENLAQQN